VLIGIESVRHFHSLIDVAISKEHVSTVKLLVPHGFLDVPDNAESVLSRAVASGDCAIFQLLLENINVISPDILLPSFMSACSHGHIDILRIILSSTTFPLNHLNDGLLQACRNGHADLAREPEPMLI
jgi:hypothetical protein